MPNDALQYLARPGYVVSVARVVAHLRGPDARADGQQEADQRDENHGLGGKVPFQVWRREVVAQDRDAEQHAEKGRDAFDDAFPRLVECLELLRLKLIEGSIDALAL